MPNNALLENGIVTNIAYFEGEPSAEYLQIMHMDAAEIPEGTHVSKGDTYQDGRFFAPDGEERLPYIPPEVEPYTVIDLSALYPGAEVFLPESQAEAAQAEVDDKADRLEAMQILFGEEGN